MLDIRLGPFQVTLGAPAGNYHRAARCQLLSGGSTNRSSPFWLTSTHNAMSTGIAVSVGVGVWEGGIRSTTTDRGRSGSLMGDRVGVAGIGVARRRGGGLAASASSSTGMPSTEASSSTAAASAYAFARHLRAAAGHAIKTMESPSIASSRLRLAAPGQVFTTIKPQAAANSPAGWRTPPWR